MVGFLCSRTRLLLAGLLILNLTLLAGCNSGAKNKTGTVQGTVKVDGTNANSGIVTFVAADGTTPSGTIDTDGTYRVLDVPVGAAKISVKSVEVPKNSAGAAAPPPMKDMTGTSSSAPPAKPVAIPAKYAKADTSTLTYTVKGGTNDYPIDLSSK